MDPDPYTEKASKDASADEKAKEVEEIIEHVQTAMLTTRHSDGSLNARAMHPVKRDGLVFEFIANNHSGKFEELAQDHACNVSFYDSSSTDWVSVAGQAKIIDDHEEIKKIWKPSLKAWFGDLGDKKHTGDYNDPRVSAIRVTPTEIRYWHAKSKISQTVEIAKARVTGHTAAPGVLRVLNSEELTKIRDICSKHV
ncbi:hypothetical protein CROQUDRAFT_654504 [Cronartium quercuum f. sp. fusiforme G11]|uniref:General stress protein FMN-binding split barrel domain-containing protein n=1 Tax=Cronartium quercuum f. sp. fusiforme G11 TaxID=708437 RepID=A0A9P6NR04_9BASI|nr:hypothetical protein CROQUDRAFT_654504 [Cronartium quercuum f. sp. fusiforme G11]